MESRAGWLSLMYWIVLSSHSKYAVSVYSSYLTGKIGFLSNEIVCNFWMLPSAKIAYSATYSVVNSNNVYLPITISHKSSGI